MTGRGVSLPTALLASAAGGGAAAYALSTRSTLLLAVGLAIAVVGGVLLGRRLSLARAAVAVAAALVLAAGSSWLVHRRLRGEGNVDARVEAPVPGPALTVDVDHRALRFAVWSDARGGLSTFDRLLDDVAGAGPDLHVGLGDFVGMARTYQFEILEARLARAGVPYRLVPGNHDRDPDGGLRAYARVFGPASWELRAGGCLLVAIDTSAGLAWADVERVERAFAQAIRPGALGRDPLERPRTGLRDLVLLTHRPLFPPAGRTDKTVEPGEAADRLRALVRRHRAHVFAGNFHGYDALDLGGHHQVVTGGAGSKPEGDAPYHYVWVDSDDAGFRFRRVDVAPRAGPSRAREAWTALRDEAPYAARVAPVRVALAAAALGLLAGTAIGSIRRRGIGGVGRQRGTTATTA